MKEDITERYAKALRFIKGRTTPFTRRDLEQALDIEIHKASTVLKRLKREGRITQAGASLASAYYVVDEISPRPVQTQLYPAAENAKPGTPERALTPTPSISIEMENAIQSFTTAVVNSENLRNENERLKQALTQILTIASNALLK